MPTRNNKSTSKRSHSASPSPSMQMLVSSSGGNLRRHPATLQQHPQQPPPPPLVDGSNTSTCDNFVDNDSNVRKHKKHKKEKRAKHYNHVDERSAPPNILLESQDSMSMSLGGSCGGIGGGGIGGGGGGAASGSLPNHLIFPDNDSLSNISLSASRFASAASTGNKHAATTQPAANLTFAGHFTRSDSVIDVDSIPAPLMHGSVSREPSRSTSPSIFQSAALQMLSQNNSNLSEHDVVVSTAASASASAAAATNHLHHVVVASSTAAPTVVPPPISQHQSAEQQQQQQRKPLVKVPKKPGRKKGSKGIDSLLASQNEGSLAALYNPDSYQDLKQKITLISGPNKKNKTAQELLAEIQSKKSSSGNVSAVTSPSVTQAPSPSSLSGWFKVPFSL